MEIVARRICWPTPDVCCLEGGCGYCNERPFRSLRTIRSYAFRTGQMAAYRWGDAHRWGNAEVRMPTASLSS